MCAPSCATPPGACGVDGRSVKHGARMPTPFSWRDAATDRFQTHHERRGGPDARRGLARAASPPQRD